MADLALYLLGAPRIEHNGQPIRVNTRKAIALAAYLGITAVSHHRDTLTTLLWPELNPQRSRAALRTTLSALKKAIGAESLIIANDTIGLAPSYWCDVIQFQQLVKSSDDQPSRKLQEAVDLYRGHFLAGFTLSDSAPFDEWQYFQTDALQQQLGSALQQLVTHYQAQAQFNQAITQCRRWLTLDPLHETAHQQLMTLYATLGQQGSALRQYEQLSQLLNKELGVTPTDSSTILYEDIKNGRFTQQQKIVADPFPWPNLYPSTSFIGRQKEMAQINERLADPNCRLLTLIGLGGAGKTRLALQVGQHLKSGLFTTAVFVPLAAVKPDAAHLITAIAAATHFQFFSRENPQTQFLNFLKEKKWLLVLDNFEHLQSCKPVLVEILQNAPHIKILVTSRERLHLQGEWLFEIHGLPLPQNKPTNSDSITLFQQRAYQLAPNLDLTTDKDSIAQICYLVEGLPLGIELAAAWVRVLSCPEIAIEIKRNLDFLTTQANNMPTRHRSLRAVFNHSWHLLDDVDQQTFRQLSVFQGGFTRETAVAILGTNLHQLSTLADKSLLRYDHAGRYHIPEALHPYAAEQLHVTQEEATETRMKHGRFFATFMQQHASTLKGGGQQQALKEITTEIDNIRLAWSWATTQYENGIVAQMLTTLARFYEMRNLFSEGLASFSKFIDWPEQDEITQKIKAQGLARYGRFCHRLGKLEQAHSCQAQSLHLARKLKSDEDIAFSLNNLGYIFWSRGDYEKAQEHYQESLTLYRQMDDQWGISQVLNHLAILPQDLAETRALLQESLKIVRQLGDLWSETRLLNNLGFAVANRTESQQLWQACATLCQELEDRYLLTFPLINLGHSARVTGEFEQAQHCYQDSLDICQEIGYQQGIARNLGHLGRTAYNLGEYELATQYCQSGMTQAQVISDQRGIGMLFYTLGQVAMATDKFETAVHHFNNSLDTFQQSQDRQGEAWPLLGLAEYHLQSGLLADAETNVKMALTIFEEIGDKTGVVFAQSLLAVCLTDMTKSQEYLEMALNTAVSLQSPPLIMTVLTTITNWHLSQGNQQKAYVIADFVSCQERLTAVTKTKITHLKNKLPNSVELPNQKLRTLDDLLSIIFNSEV